MGYSSHPAELIETHRHKALHKTDNQQYNRLYGKCFHPVLLGTTMSLLPLAAQTANDVAQQCVDTETFPLWLRVTHFINFLLMGVLIRSGIEIIASHPRFYFKDQCEPGSEWIRFTKDKVPLEEGAFTARDDQRDLSPLISLPGRAKIGLGRAWHGVATSFWLLNGVVYVAFLVGTGAWQRLVPTTWRILPDAWDSLLTYAHLRTPSLCDFTPYDSLQQLGYFFIVFIAAPLMIVTGPVMSPAVVGRFPWYAKMFGGRQAARSLHLIGMFTYLGFAVVHVGLVFIVHAPHNLTHIVFGYYDPSRVGQAYVTVIATIIVVVALWIAMSYWTLTDTRRSQRILWDATRGIRHVTVDRFNSQQAAKRPWTEKDISKFHWVNTRTPSREESPEYQELAANDFADFRLEVGGMVSEPASFSLEELKAIASQSQITMHTCMQGWTGIAKWTGIRVRDLLEQVGQVEPEAGWVMFESFGMAQHMHDGRPVEPYYTCLSLDMALEDDTILAWARNDEPLSGMFGAPLRLRCETSHGYKMIKWVRSVTVIRHYSEVGDGMGGTREDSGYQDVNARI